MQFLQYSNFYLVGIKGVAMTALAQCLIDAGKKVSGADLAEEFVTQPILDRLKLKIDLGFEGVIPPETDCVIYTGAHQGKFNPLVVKAAQLGLPTLSHAQAQAELFNSKNGMAVCGVGGKSTTSAMLTWILEKNHLQPSFSVGVGGISGMDRTGAYRPNSELMVVEADEYAVDPSAPQRQEQLVPRFAFLHAQTIICTNIKFDHPDVYHNFDETMLMYQNFFCQLKTGGHLIANITDQAIINSMARFLATKIPVIYFGKSEAADYQVLQFSSEPGITTCEFKFQNQTYELKLPLPGEYNALNALAAIAASDLAGVKIEDAIQALSDFHSTKRRCELIGEKNGVKYYDDYAHHPSEISSVIKAYKNWFPENRLVVAFQSHTFSRTKALFHEFISAFELADQVLMIDIFPSAREAFDPTITSDLLCAAINAKFPQLKAVNLKTINGLAGYFKNNLQAGDVCLTLGAGDIYKVHDLL